MVPVDNFQVLHALQNLSELLELQPESHELLELKGIS